MALTFLQSATDTTEQTTYTFSSQNLGTARSDRYIIVAVSARGLGTTRIISSATIAGVSATIVNQTANIVSHTSVAALLIAAVPTGTSGDVVVTFDAQMLRCGIGMYRATNLVSATATDSGGSTASNPTDTLTTVDGGIAIGVIYSVETAPAVSWTNVTEQYDADLEGTASGGMNTSVSGTSVVVTATLSVPANQVGSFASWDDSAADPATATGKPISNMLLMGV